MASSKALTGGTGDVNPQQLTAILVQTGVDATTDLEIALPVPRAYATKQNRALVVELIKAEVSFNNFTLTASANRICTIGTQPLPTQGDDSVFVVCKEVTAFGDGTGFIDISPSAYVDYNARYY